MCFSTFIIPAMHLLLTCVMSCILKEDIVLWVWSRDRFDFLTTKAIIKGVIRWEYHVIITAFWTRKFIQSIDHF